VKQQKFSIKKRIKSFVYAFNGIRILINEEHNSRVHLLAAICAIIAAIIFKISDLEWIAIIFSIGFVISVEAINSAIENIADFISPEKHQQIKKIKDLAAASVLIGAITSLSIGLIIFLPKILKLC
jgi:diacylglycerol kinase